MIINLIAAMAPNRVIGKDNKLPWNYPEDLKYFKKMTSGQVVVMGRKTFLAIGRALPNRRNVVLTSQKIDKVLEGEGLECYSSIPEMIKTLESDGIKEVRVIGGANIYAQFIDIADFIYMTEIKKEYVGDTYFPAFEEKYEEVAREDGSEMDFVIYRRIIS